jgi:hypothetical protein
LEELSRSPYAKEFKFVCVDPGPRRQPIPEIVKAVPTLIIAGEREPRTDGAVMNWLSERRLMERQNVSSAPVHGEPVSEKSELMGFEDSFERGEYAYLSENTNVSDSTSVRLVGNMVSIHDFRDSKPSGSSSDTPKMSAKAQALDNAFAAFQANRDKDLPIHPQRR